ncbi:hypothetical protein GCM10023080_023980 [Streptomyces pseudoechinosporeus]
MLDESGGIILRGTQGRCVVEQTQDGVVPVRGGQAGQGRLPRLTGAVDQHHASVVERFRDEVLGMAPNQIIASCHASQSATTIKINGHLDGLLMDM